MFCRTYGLDSDSALNLYITTLLLQEKADNEHSDVVVGDAGLTHRDEATEAGREDVLERVRRIVPQLSSTADLIVSLYTAFRKVRLATCSSAKHGYMYICLYLITNTTWC